MDTASRLRVWCLLRDQFAHVKPVEKFLHEAAEFVYDGAWDPRRMLDSKPDILLCINDYAYDVVRCLDAARRAGIPSLAIQDGILEWRCQYENPSLGAGGGAPQHQPVLADRIACIGPSSARHILRWGNSAKVELTGMPRLDELFARRSPSPRRPARRILVMTAKKPAFTGDQMELTVRSLKDVQDCLAGLSGVETVWRLTKGLSALLGVRNQMRTVAGNELADLVGRVDAVISTPSTAMLEAMILGRPVACLDYHNVPRFVSTAWTISAPRHLPAVINELLNPPAPKMVFQRVCLEDSLASRGRAGAKVARLMGEMAAASRARRGNGRLKFFPAWNPEDRAEDRQDLPTLGELYPGQDVFRVSDPRQLQIRLARAEKENAFLKTRLRARGVGHWIELLGRKTARSLNKRLGPN